MKKILSIVMALLISSGAVYANNFSDVQNHWAKDSIEKAIVLGYMKGYQDNTFGANKKVTREELAAIIVRLAGDPSTSTSLNFNDTKGRWSEQAILKSVASDFMVPINSTTFAPAQNATREEVARAVQRALRYKGVTFQNSSETFSDNEKSLYKGEISNVVSYKIMGGYPDGTFAPRKPITRAELASILVRATEVMNGGVLIQAQSSPKQHKPAEKSIPKSTSTPNAKPKQSSNIITVSIQTQTGSTTVQGRYHSEYALKVLELINIERKKAGVPELSWGTSMDAGTALRAAEIAKKFEHERPNGKDCFSVGTDFYAENIAAYQASPEEVVSSWMNSAGHRANILNPQYTQMSVALFIEQAPTTYNGMYWVQHFRYNA